MARALLVALALASASVAGPRRAEARPPSGTGLTAFIDAVNRGDAPGAAALFAPGDRYRGVLVCAPEACVGGPAIWEALALEVGDHTQHRLLGAGRGELRRDSLVPLVERVVYAADCAEGPDGITDLLLDPDTADDQTAQVLAAAALVRARLDDWAAAGGEGPLTLPFPDQ